MNKEIREYEESELKKTFETKSKLKTCDMMKENTGNKQCWTQVPDELQHVGHKIQLLSQVCCSAINTQNHLLFFERG